MPNWCNNTLEITHPDPAQLERARVAFKEGRLLDEFVPVPKSLHIVAGRVGDDTDPLQIDLEAQEKANLEAHGYATWWDYCVNEWGTKWDVGGDDLGPAQDIPGGLIMCFYPNRVRKYISPIVLISLPTTITASSTKKRWGDHSSSK